MSAVDFDECDCMCHVQEGVMHIMACCHQCPICHKNIKPFVFDDHVQRCEKRKDDLDKLISECTDAGC